MMAHAREAIRRGSRLSCCAAALALALAGQVAVPRARAEEPARVGAGAPAALRLLSSPFSATDAPAPFRQGAVIVGFRTDVAASRQRAIERAVGAVGAEQLGPSVRPVRENGVLRAHPTPLLLQVPAPLVLAIVSRLQAESSVAYAEPDYLMNASATPNDPSFSLQWADSNTGQSIPTQNGNEELGSPVDGTPGADERTARAWNVTTGSSSIVIGEADTGIEYTHPDLAANVWTNPGGVGQCAAGTHGYNVLTKTCDPMDDDTFYGGHGTHVAGIMGAAGNNGVGVAGVNWQTSLLPVKWLNSSASGETSGLIAALQWLVAAKQEGVNIRVVNDSATFKGTAFSQALSEEIDTLGQNNILFVTAAGNTGENDDEESRRRYPCGYDRPTEICVTATNNTDQLPNWANYGLHTVQLAAPGESIYSTLREGKYGYLSGGSMASAQVSGAAALVLSVKPALSVTELRSDILESVDKLSSLETKVSTGGRLDVCKAIPGCLPPVNSSAPTISGTAQQEKTLTEHHGKWTNEPLSGYSIKWLRCNSSGAECAAIAGAEGPTYTPVEADVGHELRVSEKASNAGGESEPATSEATLPVSPSYATFGNSTVGSLASSLVAERKSVSRYQLPQPGSVLKLSVYLQPTRKSGQQQLSGVIYADAEGVPGALLASSEQLVFQRSSAAGWYDLGFATPVKLAAGNYWIGVLAGATSKVAGYRYDRVTRAGDFNANAFAAGASNPFGSAKRGSVQASLYATYTPS
jgi:thermitase